LEELGRVDGPIVRIVMERGTKMSVISRLTGLIRASQSNGQGGAYIMHQGRGADLREYRESDITKIKAPKPVGQAPRGIGLRNIKHI
jgi:hypothetical protein